jgi:retron-type reverse transcriptase
VKRIGYLFEKAFTVENLYLAYQAASKGKHGVRGCHNFEKRLGFQIHRLHESLHAGRYRPQPYHSFMVYEPKPRIIYAPSFADLVVQHAIYRIIGPIFDRTFIDQSFACRKGKGTHKAADYAQTALQQSDRDSVNLKMDIRKFFYRIDRGILRKQIERKIKDRRFVDAMMLFADHGEPVGIPIGNLLSQIFALIYMNGIDHFIKRDLKAKHYCRYVDDFVIFGINRQTATNYLGRIIGQLKGLALELSKYSIAAVKNGINFVGYRTWASKRFVRKRSLFVFNRAVKQGRIDAIMSLLAHARRTHSLKHLITILKEKYYDLLLPKAYRQYSHC